MFHGEVLDKQDQVERERERAEARRPMRRGR
jgi:hypothetical protein